MEKQKNLIPKKEMKIVPFRIKPSDEPDNYAEVYSFLIKGSSKDAYEVEIEIDNFNDLGLTDTRCTCPDHTFRQVECKHIRFCKKILNEFDIKTDTADKPSFKLSDKSKEELEQMKKDLDLPPIAEKIICRTPTKEFLRLEKESGNDIVARNSHTKQETNK